MLATGSLVSAATAARVAVGCVTLWGQRTPPLFSEAMSASIGTGETRQAQAVFRDDLLALARESAELSWRELRRGVDDFDRLTRPAEATGTRPHRPYRVKL